MLCFLPCFPSTFCVALFGSFARFCDGRPTLGDLVALETPLHEAVKLHRCTACGIFPAPDIAAHYLVALGNHVLDGDLNIWHEIVHPPHHLLLFFYPTLLVTSPASTLKVT